MRVDRIVLRWPELSDALTLYVRHRRHVTFERIEAHLIAVGVVPFSTTAQRMFIARFLCRRGWRRRGGEGWHRAGSSSPQNANGPGVSRAEERERTGESLTDPTRLHETCRPETHGSVGVFFEETQSRTRVQPYACEPRDALDRPIVAGMYYSGAVRELARDVHHTSVGQSMNHSAQKV